MINAYLEKSYQKYCEKIFLFAKREEIFLKDIESSWYMHKSFSEDLEFRKFYASYKKKKNQAAIDNYINNLMADPYINIESDKYFGIHQNRLRENRASAYQGRIYYLGKKEVFIIDLLQEQEFISNF
tara:strand:- start:16 stop:396 length:381 start_codon:yes stop_codon:yes gene_type:complete